MDRPRAALVLGCDERSGLSVIRSLGRAGIAVDVAWLANPIVAESRYVRTVCAIPSPADAPDAWLDRLAEQLQRVAYDLVIPCNDPAILPIQKHRDGLEPYARIYLLGDEMLRTCFDKYNTALLADRCGVRQPKWRLLREPNEIDEVLKTFDVPLVVKPISSFDIDKPEHRRNVKIVRRKDDVVPVLTEFLRENPVLVQSYFEGRGAGVELIAKDGDVLFAFQHERVHEPTRGGGSSYRRSVSLNKELLEASAALVRALRYTGVMMVEFRVDAATGDWILVEINGRFWGSLPLAVAAKADFPLYLFQMLVEGRTRFPQRYTTGLYARNLSADLQWAREKVRERNFGALSPLHALPALGRAFLLRERLDTLTTDDPKPGLREIGKILDSTYERAGKALSRKSGYRAMVRRRRVEKAAGQLAGARKFLFVCKGNICRSPFAELYLRSLAPQLSVSSAGTYHMAGRSSPDDAQAVALEFGIDLKPHRSCVVGAEMVEEADIAVVFDDDNDRRLRRMFPSAAAKIVRLADLAGLDAEEIDDPFGKSEADFRTCYEAIANALSKICAKLT